MNNRFLTVAAIVLLIALALLGGVIWARVPRVHPDRGPQLQADFDQWQGADHDPVIQRFRDAGPGAVTFLAHQLESMNPSDRARGASALRAMGPAYSGTEAGRQALITALGPLDDHACAIAEGALGDLGPAARPAVPKLISAVTRELGTDDPGAGINGVWALGRIGPDARDALPLLQQVVKAKRNRLQVYAAGAVLEIGGEDPVARQVINEALRGPDAHLRVDANNVLMDLKNR